MVYSPQLASALSGASAGQLAYWRKRHGVRPPLLAPEGGDRPALYSYRDIVALRMFTQLREKVSLQKIRKAVQFLSLSEPAMHLSGHQLAADPSGRTIVWISADGDYFDVVQRPGQAGFQVVMEEVFGPYRTAKGVDVPALRDPTPGVRVDPSVRGGYPVISGTRVPFDVVASLHRDGLGDQEIADMYPSVTSASIQGASALAGLVSNISA